MTIFSFVLYFSVLTLSRLFLFLVCTMALGVNIPVFSQHHHHLKTRLPEEFSAHQPTILPVLTSDGKRLYFDRKNYAENIGGVRDFDDIWFADLLPNGAWAKPQNLGAPLNTEGSDVLCSLSPDDRWGLVYGVYDRELPLKNQGFSLTRFKEGAWAFPQPIRIENFYNRTKKYYARLAPDNRTLLLALQRDESLGGLDLYVSFRKDTSLQWSEPLHLGKTVNTSAYEGSPHLAPDGKTLYFSSEGHGGSGVADLFVTRRLDDSWQRWTTPVNLGSMINTSEEDSSIDVALDGRTAYFLSSDSAGKKGLYKAVLPDSLKHEGAVLLFGKVSVEKNLGNNSANNLANNRDKTARKNNLRNKGEREENAIPQFGQKTGIRPTGEENVVLTGYTAIANTTSAGYMRPEIQSFAETTLNESRYAMTLPAGSVYIVMAQMSDMTPSPSWLGIVDARKPDFPAESRLERREQPIVLSLQSSSPFVFPPLYCVQEQATLRPESASLPALIAFAYKTLTEKAPEVRERLKVEVVGHTCDLGTKEENEILGQERAEAVAAALELHGIPHEAITIRTEGERQPLSRSALEESRAVNRRVEVRIRW